MICPLCSNDDNRVSRSLTRADGTIRRTRQCTRCGHRWPTVEVLEEDAIRASRIREAATHLLAEINEG